MVMSPPSQSPARALGQQFMALNPQLSVAAVGSSEGGFAMCGDKAQAVRTVSTGGAFANALLHPIFTPLEQLYRKLPEEGIFDARPNRPAVLELGAFRVPANQTFILGEYTLQPFRFNGTVATDLVPLEAQRLPTAIGYDVNFSQFRKGNLHFEIIPTNAPANSRAAFLDPNPFQVIFEGPHAEFEEGPLQDLYDVAPVAPSTSDALFNAAGSTPVGNPAGDALIPPTARTGQGPQQFPFTFMINENDAVQIRVYVFEPIDIPIAFFQASISGYLVPTQRLELLLRAVEPCW